MTNIHSLWEASVTWWEMVGLLPWKLTQLLQTRWSDCKVKSWLSTKQMDGIRWIVATWYAPGTRTGAGKEKHPKLGESLAPLRDETYTVYFPDNYVWKLTPLASRIQIKPLNDCKTFSSKFTVVNTQVGNQSGWNMSSGCISFSPHPPTCLITFLCYCGVGGSRWSHQLEKRENKAESNLPKEALNLVWHAHITWSSQSAVLIVLLSPQTSATRKFTLLFS